MNKEYKKFFAVMMLIACISALVSLVGMTCIALWNYQGVTIDEKGMALVIGLMLFGCLLNVLLIVHREKFAKTYNKRNFARYIEQVFHLEYDYLLEHGPSNLLEKVINAVNGIYLYTTDSIVTLWVSIFIILATLVFAILTDVKVALLLLVALPINVIGYRLINKELAVRTERMQRLTAEGFQEIISQVSQPDYMKQLPDSMYLIDRMGSAIEKVYGSMSEVNVFAQSTSSLIKGITMVMQNFIMLMVVFLFYQNKVNPYMLMLSTIAVPMYFSSVSTITSININKRDYRFAKDYYKQLEDNRESDGSVNIGNIEKIDLDVTAIKFKNKTIKLNAKDQLEKGDVVQIDGVSGSGKSSFVKGLVGFRGISGIRINGESITNISKESLRSRVEYVSQNIPIIKGTLKDNLLFGKDASLLTKDSLERFSFLESVFSGKNLDDVIFENGANLSGGEKQKIAVARALLSSPEVLILDEVCSNMDATVSEEIYQMLKNERQNRITIVITHDELPDGFVNKHISIQ